MRPVCQECGERATGYTSVVLVETADGFESPTEAEAVPTWTPCGHPCDRSQPGDALVAASSGSQRSSTEDAE